MNKTFITKFPSSVDNDNLPIYGRIVIGCIAGRHTANDIRYILLQFTKPTTLKKISGANFSYQVPPYGPENSSGFLDNAELKANVIYKIVFDNSDVDTYLAIDGKYYIKSISNFADWNSADIRLNLDDLKYCGNLRSISIPCTENVINGNLKNVNEGITSLAIRYNKDLDDISHLTALTSLDLRRSNLSKRDVSALSTLVNLTNLNISETNISGDVSALSTLVNLTNLDIGRINISGDATSLVNNMTKLKNLRIPNTITITDEQKKTLTDRGCTVIIVEQH